jgi:hypothetical protein
MKKPSKSKHKNDREKQIAKIERGRKTELKALDKKMLEEKVAFTINFFKDQGKIITRNEAIQIMKQLEDLPPFKEYQAEIQPLIKQNVAFEKEIKSLESLIEEQKAELRNIEDKIRKNIK